MRKCVIIPDPFKGSMESINICRIIAEEVYLYYPECNTILVPVADGGSLEQVRKMDVSAVRSIFPGRNLDIQYKPGRVRF